MIQKYRYLPHLTAEKEQLSHQVKLVEHFLWGSASFLKVDEKTLPQIDSFLNCLKDKYTLFNTN